VHCNLLDGIPPNHAHLFSGKGLHPGKQQCYSQIEPWQICKVNSTTHLTTIGALKSDSIQKQIGDVIKVTKDVSATVQSWSCTWVTFLKHLYLFFATEDTVKD
jgi:hypothetical protein